MSDIFRPHIEALCRDEIELAEFEERCRQSWVEENGPVPEGRFLYVGCTFGSAHPQLIVGHAALPPIIGTPWPWKFKSLGASK